MDGANMNAQVGITSPVRSARTCATSTCTRPSASRTAAAARAWARSCAEHLTPFLPGTRSTNRAAATRSASVSAAPVGKRRRPADLLRVHRDDGSRGLRRATEVAILNANYIAKRLSNTTSRSSPAQNGYVAHECILDCRRIEKETGGSPVEDIAKRLPTTVSTLRR
jgi:glycine dehydrogenase